MKYIVPVRIECGETTCTREPGKFCPQIRTTHFGQVWICALFNKEVSGPNGNPEGWLQRLPECIAQAVEVEVQAFLTKHSHTL
jgi:hypothetical protein